MVQDKGNSSQEMRILEESSFEINNEKVDKDYEKRETSQSGSLSPEMISEITEISKAYLDVYFSDFQDAFLKTMNTLVNLFEDGIKGLAANTRTNGARIALSDMSERSDDIISGNQSTFRGKEDVEVRIHENANRLKTRTNQMEDELTCSNNTLSNSEVCFSNYGRKSLEANVVKEYTKETRVCYFCKKQGHLRANCRKLAKTKMKRNVNTDKNRNNDYNELELKRKTYTITGIDLNTSGETTRSTSLVNAKGQKSKKLTSSSKAYSQVIRGDKFWKNSHKEETPHFGIDDIIKKDEKEFLQDEVFIKPRNHKELIMFLGTCQFFKRKIGKCWWATGPLFNALKEPKWQWNNELNQAFKMVTEKLYLIQDEQRQRALELEKARTFQSVEKFQIGSHTVIESDDKVNELSRKKFRDECGSKTEVVDIGITDVVCNTQKQRLQKGTKLTKAKALIDINVLEVEVANSIAKRSIIRSLEDLTLNY